MEESPAREKSEGHRKNLGRRLFTGVFPYLDFIDLVTVIDFFWETDFSCRR